MADSMSDILSDAPPAAPEPEAQAPEAQDAAPAERPQYQSRKQAHQEREFGAQGLVRDPETGQFAKKVDTPAAEAAPQEQKPDAGAKEPVAAQPTPAAAAPEQMTEKERAFLRAAQEERGKRQELEKRLAALESAKPAEPAKTFWDDPEGALKAQEQKIEGIVTQTRLATAEAIARGKYTDFDAKVAVFQEVLQSTPGIYQQWLSSPDPAEFAYRTGKNHQDLQAAGSLDAMREQVAKETEARVRAQVEAELKAKYEAAAKERAALPGSLSDARSTAQNRPVWSGPPPMSDILG